MIEGVFDYSNGGLINSEGKKERNRMVSMHETVHAQLTTTTTYGQFVQMLNKNIMFTPQYGWLKDELFSYMSRMQERIAVNIETISICINEGSQKYLDAIERLKMRNTKYYGYFRKLCSANGKVKDKESADKIANLLLEIGRIALNVNLEKIPFESFSDNRDLQRFLTRDKNSLYYLPNTRFDIMFNFFFRQKFDKDEIEVLFTHEFIEDTHSIIHQNALNAAKRLYMKSSLSSSLIERADSVGNWKIDIEGSRIQHLLNMPLNLSDSCNICKSKILNTEKFLALLVQHKYKDMFVRLEHAMGGFENIHMLTFFDHTSKTRYSTCCIDDNQFIDLIKRIPQYIIFIQMKLFGKLKSQITGLVNRLPIFIVLENYVAIFLSRIKTNFSGGHYTYIEKKQYFALVVYRRNYVCISYIIEEAKIELDNILPNEYNITYEKNNQLPYDFKLVNIVVENCMQDMVYSYNEIQKNI